MKTLRLFLFIGLLGIMGTSCSNDDNTTIPVDPNPDEQTQKKIGTKFLIDGDFEFAHAGAGIDFTFNEITFEMDDSGLGGAKSTFNLVAMYQEVKSGVYKAILKDGSSKAPTIYLRNIKENSMEINIDWLLNPYENGEEAEKAEYPTANATIGNHDGGQFGWLVITRKTGAPITVNLPISGKYVFSQQGHTYYYTFSNNIVNFNGSYDMEVLGYSNTNNKILLKGADKTVEDRYYVIQLKNITENSVDILRKTYSETNAQAEAEAEFAKAEDADGGFNTYIKESNNDEAFANLQGTYGSAIINDADGNPQAQYVFKIGNNDEAFLFRADMGGGFSDSASFILNRVFTDESKGQLIYEVTGSTGYYSGREGQFLTIYVRNISASGDKATFAIATKDGSTSVAASKGDVIGKTLEEAKAIAAPADNLVWDLNMMNYAHRWIETTKE